MYLPVYLVIPQVGSHRSIILPVISFLFAISIYPPTAMFYWVMIGMEILFSPDIKSDQFKMNIFNSMAVGLISLSVFASSVFFMHFFFQHKISFALYNPYVINHDWPGKIRWFFQEPISNALNLWNIFPKASSSILIAGFIGLTALIVLTKKLIHTDPHHKKDAEITFFWRFCLFIFVFFLSFLPNLAAQGNIPFYRCLIPLTCFIWLILVWAIYQWMGLFQKDITRWSVIALLLTITVYAGIKTYHNILSYRVLPSYLEWNAIEGE